jgi:hypothetical protein
MRLNLKSNFFFYIFFSFLFIIFFIYTLIENERFKFLVHFVGKNAKKIKIQKYLIYKCTNQQLCGGWADRIEGIFSIYAWSLLSQREFRIFIDYPCLINTILHSNEIPWDQKIFKNKDEIKNMNKVQLNFIDDLKFANNIYKTDYFNEQEDHDLIIILNNQDWIKSFSKNEKLHSKIKILGYEPSKFRIEYLMREWYFISYLFSTY